MRYEKPELNVEKFTFEAVMGDFPSTIDPEGGPILEDNDPTIEIQSAFGEVLNFSK